MERSVGNRHRGGSWSTTVMLKSVIVAVVCTVALREAQRVVYLHPGRERHAAALLLQDCEQDVEKSQERNAATYTKDEQVHALPLANQYLPVDAHGSALSYNNTRMTASSTAGYGSLRGLVRGLGSYGACLASRRRKAQRRSGAAADALPQSAYWSQERSTRRLGRMYLPPRWRAMSSSSEKYQLVQGILSLRNLSDGSLP